MNQWISDQIKYVQTNFLDGVNIDIEEPVEKNGLVAKALTIFANDVAFNFHHAVPGSQVRKFY